MRMVYEHSLPIFSTLRVTSMRVKWQSHRPTDQCQSRPHVFVDPAVRGRKFTQPRVHSNTLTELKAQFEGPVSFLRAKKEPGNVKL